MKASHVTTMLIIIFLLASGVVNAAGSTTPAPGQLEIRVSDMARPWHGDFDAMVDRGVVRVLTVYSKTFYFIDQGVQRGATHDLFRQFEEDINKKLAQEKKLKKNLKLRVVFIPVRRDELFDALVEGRGDIAAASLTITDARSKRVDFSIPVYPGVDEVVISGPGSPAVTSIDDLAGQVVFVRKSSSYFESLQALNRRFAQEKKPRVIIKPSPEVLEDEDLIEMVNAGLMPLTVVDRPVADFWQQVFPAVTVHHDIALRSGGNIAWALRKDSPQLKAVVDDFLKRNAKGSLIGNTILARYLKNASYVKDAASETERKKFLDLVNHFRKYSDQYHVDWLLMAAQGYQESQLNQDVRSKSGAIGVMQVMPATGKELNVGDIRQVEPNIHAGIKYMRSMMDHYYGDQPMTQLDKVLFTFASYNAGPARIAQLRKEATLRGLDPNVWFHNVEYVAAEKIGSETVTYVSNIYKYYIAYQLLVEGQAARKKAVETIKSSEKQK